MKVLLIAPRFGEGISRYPPALGIAYLAAVLRENAIPVGIIDGSTYPHLAEFGEDCARIRPDIVGISIMSMLLDQAIAAAETVRAVLPEARIVVGGPHPTTLPEETVRIPCFDFVLAGEAEYTFLALVRELEKGNSSPAGIEGLYAMRGGEIVFTPKTTYIQDLDALPMPARDLLPMERYSSQPPTLPLPYPTTTVYPSRGCPYGCRYCQPTLRKLFGSGVRYRSPVKVVEEMKLLKDRYGVRGVFFCDDEPTLRQEWVMELSRELIRRRLGLKWGCTGRVDTLTYEMLRLMKRAGCINLSFGVESGCQETLDFYRKGVTVEQIKSAFRLCRRAGINARANMMIGAPWETREAAEESVALIREIKPDFVFTAPATPTPGSDLFHYAREHRLLRKKTSAIHYCDISTMKRNLTDEEVRYYIGRIVKAYKRELIVSLLNPITLWRRRHLFGSILMHFATLAIGNPRLLLRDLLYYARYEHKEQITASHPATIAP